ncbi:hypothetical protein JTB14_030755 [Gonioctena quinquepunctata]|nr:hypothetical protein JTB14_030755 [Gonioctena quinquepunctata]
MSGRVKPLLDVRMFLHLHFKLTVLFVVDKNVLRLARERNDDYGPAIIERLAAVHDLRAADAQYHFLCMKDLNRPRRKTHSPTGGRPSDEVDDAMQSIFEYLENSSDETQFRIEELMNEIDPNCTRHHPKTVENLLLEKYGSDILITEKIPYIVCFKGTGHKIITDSWYDERLPKDEERLRIVETSAAIIFEDARSKVFETNAVVLAKKKGDINKWRKESIAIVDCLFTTVRPNSYVSPLQMSVAEFLYRKYGSRRLLDVICSLGYCTSYQEAVRFETSSVMQPLLAVWGQALSQLVYDNVDFNVRTILYNCL